MLENKQAMDLLEALWQEPQVAKLVEVLAPHPLFLVGGVIRDALLGLPIKDLDFVLELPPKAITELKAKFSESLGTSVGVLDAERGILRFYRGDESWFDVASCQGDDIVSDLKRRDFSINAMAIDPSGKLWDPFGGRNALEQGVLRVVSDQALTDDPLRVMRAFRLAASLRFTIEDDTRRLMKSAVGGLKQVAGERIKEELLRFFSQLDPELLQLFRRVGVASALFSLKESQVPWLWLEQYLLTRSAPYHCLALLACLIQNKPQAVYRLKPSRKQLSYLRFWQAGCKFLDEHPANCRQRLELLNRSGEALEQVLEFAQLEAFGKPLPPGLASTIVAESKGEGSLNLSPLPLSGRDLCARFRKPAGPWVGELLKELGVCWACRELTSLDELWRCAEKLWSARHS